MAPKACLFVDAALYRHVYVAVVFCVYPRNFHAAAADEKLFNPAGTGDSGEGETGKNQIFRQFERSQHIALPFSSAFTLGSFFSKSGSMLGESSSQRRVRWTKSFAATAVWQRK